MSLPEEVLTKDFVKRVHTTLTSYAKEIHAWRRENNFAIQGNDMEAKEPRMSPLPSKSINTSSDLSPTQKTVLKGIISMLRVTCTDWTQSSFLKATVQLIKAAAPVILRRLHTAEILAMEAPWSLRCSLKELLSVNLRKDELWQWWDGVEIRPKSTRTYAMDIEFIPDLLDGETEGNTAIRTLTIPQMREKNRLAMQKAIDALMIPNLGAIRVYADHCTASPRFLGALHNLMHVSTFSSYK